MNNSNNNNRVRQFIVNLDDNPYHRWDHVAREYKDKIKDVERYIDQSLLSGGWLARGVLASVQGTLGVMAKLNLVAYAKELKGLSRELSIPLGKMVAMQLIYEASTCCTSMVIPDNQNNQVDISSSSLSSSSSSTSSPSSLVLARTMDWSMDCLKDITVEIDFHQSGASVMKATTWVGYVGVLTGIASQSKTAVSINYRRSDKGSFMDNIKNLISYKWPVGYLVRHVLSTATNYQAVAGTLELSGIVAPCFMTIATVDKGIVLARDPESVFRKSHVRDATNTQLEPNIQTSFNNKNKNNNCITTQSNYFVQTNNEEQNDNDNNFLYSNERRCLAKQQLAKWIETGEPVTDDSIWNLFSTFPIHNDDTIYGTIMNPTTYSIETRIPNTRFGFNLNNNNNNKNNKGMTSKY
ncbi:hypothetical protein DFA_06303 [Cavenderia fasciculata]|uniref:ceramidase n=1 Tax=Cavenderia fasciculata TaxID=261658 RepID=F4PKN3_CACFS|nr:uncharacterized protein DFA_06303 [Cavenderia fasciculata]EGG24157.1 hypothetical protein DFA_06303 [Cavenderia fasciculata]|eukprot:XP_004362008.1 hypothetical protein DFA_06303 [Cavenderia fasciculata]